MTQTDLAITRVQLDDLEVERISDRKPILELRLCIGILELRHVTETFDSFFDFNEDSEWRMPDDAAFDRDPRAGAW